MTTYIFVCDDGESFISVYSVIASNVFQVSELLLKSLPFDSIERKYCGILEWPEKNQNELSDCQYWLGSYQIFEIENAVTKII